MLFYFNHEIESDIKMQQPRTLKHTLDFFHVTGRLDGLRLAVFVPALGVVSQC